MALVKVKTHLIRFYKHRDDGDEVLGFFEGRNGYVHFRRLDGRGELEKMLSQQFYMEYEWIQE
jgi:hypothetical protein